MDKRITIKEGLTVIDGTATDFKFNLHFLETTNKKISCCDETVSILTVGFMKHDTNT